MLICLTNNQKRILDYEKELYIYDTDDCTLERTRIYDAEKFIKNGGNIQCMGYGDGSYGLTLDCLKFTDISYMVANEFGCLVRVRRDNWCIYTSDGYYYKISYKFAGLVSKNGYDINGTRHREDIIDDDVNRDYAGTLSITEFLLTDKGFILFLFPTWRGRDVAYVPVSFGHEYGVRCTYEQFRKRLMYGG